jgi:Fe-S-cluster containining protein
MSKGKKNTKSKCKEVIHCHKCETQADCCQLGAWIDLEEAKKILTLKLKKGDFFHLEEDKAFPSGYKVGTSYEDEKCTFLDSDGLCSVHKIDYAFKPVTCKEFPFEDGELSSFAEVLCTPYKAKIKKKRKARR